jgi:hypothetical protein
LIFEELATAPVHYFFDGTLVQCSAVAGSTWFCKLNFQTLLQTIFECSTSSCIHTISKFSFGFIHVLLNDWYLQLPGIIQEAYSKIFDASATMEVITHLKWELMQAIWFFILDGEFYEACRVGIVVLCADGIWRRLFP